MSLFPRARQGIWDETAQVRQAAEQRGPVADAFIRQLEHLRQITADKRADLARDEARLAKAEAEFIEMNRK
jgi:hypothetical protein